MSEQPNPAPGCNEKRRSVRYKVLTQAQVWRNGFPDTVQNAAVKDVSAGSVGLVFSSSPPPVGTEVTVKIGGYLYLFGEIDRTRVVNKIHLTVLKLRGSEWSAKRKLSDQLAGRLFGTSWSFELHGLNCEPFKSDVRLRRLRLLVYRYPTHRITLKTAECVTGLDPAYFSSFFKRTVGVSFRDWVNWVRVARAIILLSSSDRPVKEVADLAGFTNVRSFQRIFRQYTSLTPAQFKRLQRPHPQRASEPASVAAKNGVPE